MANGHESCPRNDGGYLIPIGETAGGTRYMCFVCGTEIQVPNEGGKEAQYKASGIEQPPQAAGPTAGASTRVVGPPESFAPLGGSGAGDSERDAERGREGASPQQPHGYR